MDLSLLKSTRFWQLFLVGINAGLITFEQTGNVNLAVSAAITAWLGGSVVVGTIDRTSDNKVAAAKIIAKAKK
jgi:hypothetical protein